MTPSPPAQKPRDGTGALVCIPTFNEKENIGPIVAAVLQAIPKANVLVIDDGSPDGTGALADSIAKEDTRVFVLHRGQKEGLGKAYIAGFSWALARGYHYVIQFDADFSHNPQYLPGFLELLQDADVVIGSRRVPGGGTQNWGWIRRLTSWGGSLYARRVLSLDVRDLTGGFNGFRCDPLAALMRRPFDNAGYGFQIELKYRAICMGFKVVESPIIFVDRTQGRSKMSRKIFAEAMLKIVLLRLKQDQ